MAIQLYKTYMFRDKDPIIDKLRTVLQEQFPYHNPAKIQYSEIAMTSGVSIGTIVNWMEGKTRRPQFATLCAVARAAGYDLALVNQANGKTIDLKEAKEKLRKAK